MKTINISFTQVFLFAACFILSCTGNNKNNESIFSGRFILSVIEKDKNGTATKAKLKSDTTFNSLNRGMAYIPDSSEWNFVNDSVLFLSKLNDLTYKPDTLVYKISRKCDTLMVFSKNEAEKFPLKKLFDDRLELDFGDQNFLCQLNKKP
ncbi:MAG: hypothetical protein U0W24_12370 [Bacteroidales bacterium]